jgi:uncharacterized protein (DUF433 family)
MLGEMVSPDALPARSAPLRSDADGVVRIGATRITLDTLVGAFLNGCTAEEIAMKYPSLDLADVYAVIAHYLWNRAEIDGYLAQRASEARVVRDEVEQRGSTTGLRDRLLARKRLAS